MHSATINAKLPSSGIIATHYKGLIQASRICARLNGVADGLGAALVLGGLGPLAPRPIAGIFSVTGDGRTVTRSSTYDFFGRDLGWPCAFNPNLLGIQPKNRS